ncbi:MAG: acetyltransferase [Candidatus Hydrogenedentes bacterium]|nr:acetyltransferase [Candidatus Hydrogenedentota bacterium]
MKSLILFPCNGNAREAVGVVEAINCIEPAWSILGFVDDDPSAPSRQHGYPILGTRACLADYPDARILAVPGRPDNYWGRLSIIDALGIDPKRFATLVHPAAHVGPRCTLGPNTLIHAGVALTASVHMEGDVVILPNSVLSHDVFIGRGTLVGSNVSIAGGVHVKSCAYVGSGARLLQDIIIGEQALIGLGSTVIHSVPPHTVVAGNPARLLRRVDAEA